MPTFSLDSFLVKIVYCFLILLLVNTTSSNGSISLENYFKEISSNFNTLFNDNPKSSSLDNRVVSDFRNRSEADYFSEGFITTWITTDGTITIPTIGTGYNYGITWVNLTNTGVGDGTEIGQTGDITISGLENGSTYEISITGNFPRIYFFNAIDRLKIRTIQQWGNIQWESMQDAFRGCNNLTYMATDSPDLMFATSLEGMFRACSSFDGNATMNNWNTASIQNMSAMFLGASNFNIDISNWTIGNVSDLSFMFESASSFNQDISIWSTVSATNMNLMFSLADSFNQDLSSWNTSNVTTMQGMFNGAFDFNQSLGNWDISNVTNMTGMLDGSGLSLSNYDATLNGWSSQSVQPNVTFGAGGLLYSTSNRAILTGAPNNWNIIGDTFQALPFITTWITNDGTITIPTFGLETYDYDLSWVNLSNPGNAEGSANNLTGNFTITDLENGSTYQLSISGQFPRIFFNNAGDKLKIISIVQWGNIEWNSMQRAFMGCSNLTYTATDVPNLNLVADLSLMFWDCSSFDGNETMNDWNTGNVIDMSSVFRGASSFNQNIGNWNTSNISDMSFLFFGASSFNQDIGNWNTQNVTNMYSMFGEATSFNQNINNWNTENVVDMSNMFYRANSFNQNIGGWNTGQVNNMEYMFYEASNFNQDISGWNTSNVLNMRLMFYRASSFDQNIGAWNTSQVNNMEYMFYEASLFNQDISGWNTNNVTDMYAMFWGASSFNQNIGGWNTSNVPRMGYLFYEAISFNQDISGWNTENVQEMDYMFFKASSFNQNISNWNTNNVTNMYRMFTDASAFDQNLGNWNIGLVSNMSEMLDGTNMSVLNYDSTLIGWSTQTLQNNVILGASGREYCSSAAARQLIIDTFEWIIEGDVICRLPQTIAFAALEPKTYGDPSFNLVASSSSGLPVTFISSNNTLLEINEEVATILGVGAVTIIANQAGNSEFLPADTVIQELNILSKSLTLTSNSITKIYGEPDPELIYSITSGELVGTDSISGQLSRQLGEDIGTYAIIQGTVDAGENYVLNFELDSLLITTRFIEIAADDQEKFFGQVDPELTFVITSGSLAFDDTISGSLSREVGENLGEYIINVGSLTAGDNYDLAFTPGLLRINLLQVNEADSMALAAIYNATSGADWLNKENWLVNPVSGWFGVSLENDRVTSLNLAGNLLNGPIPIDIINIDSLKTLILSNNQVSELPNLTSLTVLDSVWVNNNHLQFGSLEPNMSLFTSDAQYDTQSNFGVAEDIIVTSRNPFDLIFEVSGIENQYQWFKEGSPIPNANQTSFQINPADANLQGNYYLVVDNPLVPGLVLFSEEIGITYESYQLSGRIVGNEGQEVNEGLIRLLEVQPQGTAYDTVTTHLLSGLAEFTFENVFAGNYIISIDPDEAAFPRSVSGYYEEAVFWEDADTIQVSSDLDNLDITVNFIPLPEVGGASILGVLELETTVNGRLEERTRVSNARVTVRRSTSTSREFETGFVLVGERFTNANGEFTFSDLPAALYRLRFDIPGVPTDEARNIDLDLRTRNSSQVIATIVDGKIQVEEIIALSANDLSKEISLYPNPSTDVVNLILPSSGSWIYTVTDMRGSQMQSGQITTSNQDQAIRWEISDWVNGIYLIRLQNGNEVYQSRMVIRR